MVGGGDGGSTKSKQVLQRCSIVWSAHRGLDIEAQSRLDQEWLREGLTRLTDAMDALAKRRDRRRCRGGRRGAQRARYREAFGNRLESGVGAEDDVPGSL